jgi:hypothetical protein
MAYTSIRGERDWRLTDVEAFWIYQLQGAMYHLLGPLDGEYPAFAQLYFLEPKAAQAARIEYSPSLKDCPILLWKLYRCLRRFNPYHKLFRRASGFLKAHPRVPSLELTPAVRVAFLSSALPLLMST